jgi:hypothetical protein
MRTTSWLPGSAYTGTPTCSPSVCSCSTAAGRYTSQATMRVWRISRFILRASLPAVVVLPEPCSPTIMITVGGVGAIVSPTRFSPSMAVSSSCTIFTICCPGETAFSTDSPIAFSSTRFMKSRVTW